MTKISRFLALTSGVMFMVIMTLMFIDVMGRYLFGAPLTFAVEAVELLMGVAIAFGLALTTLSRGHITVDFLNHVNNRPLQTVLSVFSDILTFVFFAFAAWQLLRKTISHYHDGFYTQILEFPIYPSTFLMFAGFTFTSLVVIYMLFGFSKDKG